MITNTKVNKSLYVQSNIILTFLFIFYVNTPFYTQIYTQLRYQKMTHDEFQISKHPLSEHPITHDEVP